MYCDVCVKNNHSLVERLILFFSNSFRTTFAVPTYNKSEYMATRDVNIKAKINIKHLTCILNGRKSEYYYASR